VRFLLM